MLPNFTKIYIVSPSLCHFSLVFCHFLHPDDCIRNFDAEKGRRRFFLASSFILLFRFHFLLLHRLPVHQHVHPETATTARATNLRGADRETCMLHALMTRLLWFSSHLVLCNGLGSTFALNRLLCVLFIGNAALNRTMQSLSTTGRSLDDFTYNNNLIAKEIYSAMNATQFLGVSVGSFF